MYKVIHASQILKKFAMSSPGNISFRCDNLNLGQHCVCVWIANSCLLVSNNGERSKGSIMMNVLMGAQSSSNSGMDFEHAYRGTY